jgi:hypothetical protein
MTAECILGSAVRGGNLDNLQIRTSREKSLDNAAEGGCWTVGDLALHFWTGPRVALEELVLNRRSQRTDRSYGIVLGGESGSRRLSSITLHVVALTLQICCCAQVDANVDDENALPAREQELRREFGDAYEKRGQKEMHAEQRSDRKTKTAEEKARIKRMQRAAAAMAQPAAADEPAVTDAAEQPCDTVDRLVQPPADEKFGWRLPTELRILRTHRLARSGYTLQLVSGWTSILVARPHPATYPAHSGEAAPTFRPPFQRDCISHVYASGLRSTMVHALACAVHEHAMYNGHARTSV